MCHVQDTPLASDRHKDEWQWCNDKLVGTWGKILIPLELEE